MDKPVPFFREREILEARPPKHAVDEHRPLGFFIEPERGRDGVVALTATVLLTNRECPFRCLMCDLWRSTTDRTVRPGSITRQIDHALNRLPTASRIKLYNSGNFFDARAIPPGEWEPIVDRVLPFDSVIVENHPRLCDARVLSFRALMGGRLEIALGLETAHPDVLRGLNKRMTVEDFIRAAGFLTENDIAVRTFLLLWPPFLGEEAGIDWTHRSIEIAFAAGAEVVSLVPLRPGNGLMEMLYAQGLARSPSLLHLEQVMEEALMHPQGRIFVDLWDAHAFMECRRCGPARIARLRTMNLSQQVPEPVNCVCQPPERRLRKPWTPSKQMF